MALVQNSDFSFPLPLIIIFEKNKISFQSKFIYSNKGEKEREREGEFKIILNFIDNERLGKFEMHWVEAQTY